MPKPQIVKMAKLSMFATILSLCTVGFNAQAALISYSNAGKDLVYSSVSSVTWTKDANLFKTMVEERGFEALVDDIVTVTPSISNTPNYLSPDGNYVLSIFDFNGGDISNISGVSTWFGALAFVNYLNHINYAGSNQWQLPVGTSSTWSNLIRFGAPPFGPPVGNGSIAGDELAELFYLELGGQEQAPLPDTGFFEQEQINAYYWYANESDFSVPSTAWTFWFASGSQHQSEKGEQYFYHAWAITPGLISPIPEPDKLALLYCGLACLIAVARRRVKVSKQLN